MFSILATAVVVMVIAGSASADQGFLPKCGSGGPSHYANVLSVEYSGGHFTTHWEQDCAVQQVSVEIEIQRSTDGGNHWNDVIANGFALDTVVPTNTTGYDQRGHGWAPSACGSGLYRTKVYDAWHATSSLLNGSGGC